jgi:hypothetical protein
VKEDVPTLRRSEFKLGKRKLGQTSKAVSKVALVEHARKAMEQV